MIEEKVSKILYNLRFKEGRTRQWLANSIGVEPVYITFAAGATRRSVKKQKKGYICPKEEFNKILVWLEEHGYAD